MLCHETLRCEKGSRTILVNLSRALRWRTARATPQQDCINCTASRLRPKVVHKRRSRARWCTSQLWKRLDMEIQTFVLYFPVLYRYLISYCYRTLINLVLTLL